MKNVIGTDKQFLIVERENLKELFEIIESLSNDPGLFANGKAEGIKFMIDWIKEHNIYSKEFLIKN